LTNNVDAGGGKTLPPGDYSGSITETEVMIRGRSNTQIMRVGVFVPESTLAELFGPKDRGEGIEGDFTAAFKQGDIIEL
jgi:hypothetical protein